jgi:ABC-type bacteriocin/lantibiotic exporter with double-glycine peptidase domain
VCAVFAILLFSGVAREEIVLIFTVIVAAMARVLPALSRAHYNLTQLKQYGILLDELMDKLTGLPQENTAITSPHAEFSKDITVENISFSYTPDKTVLNNFSCRIPACRLTGISGRSGTGKTTFINLLSSLFKADCGTIKCGGIDIQSNIPAWRKQLGFVPQNVFIFDGSLKENVALGCPEEDIDVEKVKSVLRAAQLGDFADTPEMMLNSHAGLSGGQRQRIGIARALYNSPEVLILDEATSALDTETETAFLKVLENLRGKVTVIVISHRPETLAICDNIIAL